MLVQLCICVHVGCLIMLRTVMRGHDSHFVLLCPLLVGLYPYTDIGGQKPYSLACPETVELQRTTKHTVMLVLHLLG